MSEKFFAFFAFIQAAGCPHLGTEAAPCARTKEKSGTQAPLFSLNNDVN
jgi:hypothetical protein